MAYALVNGGGIDLHDPVYRAYILSTEFHMPPGADGEYEQPAVLLDDMLMLYARVGVLAAERAERHG